MMPQYKEEWNKKEFIRSMQAKGKLPKTVTDSSEAFEKAYHDTRPRIFPGPGGIQTVMENMLRDSEKRIDSAAKPGSERPAAVGGPPLPSTSISEDTQKHKAAHRELKDRLKALSKELESERSARLIAEQELTAARSGGSVGASHTITHK